ncbi:hypothetical protein ACOME3_010043 [Neoechinorhynchus agilis]
MEDLVGLSSICSPSRLVNEPSLAKATTPEALNPGRTITAQHMQECFSTVKPHSNTNRSLNENYEDLVKKQGLTEVKEIKAVLTYSIHYPLIERSHSDLSNSADYLIHSDLTLFDIRKSLRCMHEYRRVGELSNDPSALLTLPESRQVYPGSYMFIEGVFYTESFEYCVCSPIADFLRKAANQPSRYPIKPMKDTKLVDLSIHLGNE